MLQVSVPNTPNIAKVEATVSSSMGSRSDSRIGSVMSFINSRYENRPCGLARTAESALQGASCGDYPEVVWRGANKGLVLVQVPRLLLLSVEADARRGLLWHVQDSCLQFTSKA